MDMDTDTDMGMDRVGVKKQSKAKHINRIVGNIRKVYPSALNKKIIIKFWNYHY